MENNSVQQKEQLIIGTILTCNGEISKFQNSFKKSSNKSQFKLKRLVETDVYHFNMVKLISEINPLFESKIQNDFLLQGINLNESNIDKLIPSDSINIKNNRGNYCSYFQKVYHFLSGYENQIQYSLNENLKIDGDSNENLFDINSFKTDLKKIIIELLKNNDIQFINPEILKIKLFAKQPIFVYGFDICNNIGLRNELREKFNIIPENNLLSIIFNKSTKQLWFVTNNTSGIIVYDLKKDLLDFYNIVNSEYPIKTGIKLIPKEYKNTLKELTGYNDLIEIFFNVDSLELKFADNLYKDTARSNIAIKMQQEMSVVKK